MIGGIIREDSSVGRGFLPPDSACSGNGRAACGPGAFYAVGSYGVIQLNAFKGSTQVMVQLMLMTSPPDKVREALAKLMTVALPRVK
jgi:hypothetical protein